MRGLGEGVDGEASTNVTSPAEPSGPDGAMGAPLPAFSFSAGSGISLPELSPLAAARRPAGPPILATSGPIFFGSGSFLPLLNADSDTNQKQIALGTELPSLV